MFYFYCKSKHFDRHSLTLRNEIKYIIKIERKMKKISLALCALLALPVSAQKYAVTGKVPVGTKMVYLQHIGSRQQPDSVAVKDGAFTFTGDANEPFAYVIADKSEAVSVVLDGNVTVDFANDKATGTAENEALSAWNARFKAPMETYKKAMTEYYGYRKSGKEVPDSVMARIEKQADESEDQMKVLTKQCCQENKQMKFPALFLSQMASSMDKADVIKLAEEGSPAYMETNVMTRVKGSIEGWKRQMPGTQFTDIELADVNGTNHKLSEYVGKGKYVLIDFWASWCGPCRRSMPDVKKLYDEYKDKGFEIVGLSFDSEKDAWTGAIKKLDLPWIHLSDLKGWESLAGRTYGISAIPATLLIGPDGKIIASGLSAEQVGEKLKELIK